MDPLIIILIFVLIVSIGILFAIIKYERKRRNANKIIKELLDDLELFENYSFTDSKETEE